MSSRWRHCLWNRFLMCSSTPIYMNKKPSATRPPHSSITIIVIPSGREGATSPPLPVPRWLYTPEWWDDTWSKLLTARTISTTSGGHMTVHQNPTGMTSSFDILITEPSQLAVECGSYQLSINEYRCTTHLITCDSTIHTHTHAQVIQTLAYMSYAVRPSIEPTSCDVTISYTH